MSTLLREHENHVFSFAHKNCNLGAVSCDGAKLRRARGGLSHIGYSLDQVRFLANCPPTHPLIRHFALSEK